MHSQILSNDLKEFAAQRITSPHPNCLISIVWSCIQFALWCLQLSDTAQIIWMATSCALQCMFHNLRKLMHTFSICLPSWERQQPHAGFRQGSLCLLHFGHAGWPHAFVPGDEGGVVCVCVCGGGNTEPADSLQHSSRELPSALSSLSIPYSKCPRLEHDPWTRSHSPSLTQTHTQKLCVFCLWTAILKRFSQSLLLCTWHSFCYLQACYRKIKAACHFVCTVNAIRGKEWKKLF